MSWKESNTFKSVSFFVRLIISFLLLLKVYEETGVYTFILLCLLVAWTEIVAYKK